MLIIIIPTVLVQVIATYVFYERHWESVRRNMAASLAGEIAIITAGLEDAELQDRAQIIRVAANYLYLKVQYYPGKKLRKNKENLKPYPHEELLSEELRRHFTHSFQIHPPKDERSDFIVDIALPEGLVHFEIPFKRMANSTTYIFIMWMTGTAAVLLLVAIFFLRNQVETITRLAQVAEKFGKGQEVTSFKPRGAREVRRAAQAFTEMKERIKRLLTQRTEMLAGVSHDLKTPLTRMKLQLSMLEQDDRVRSLRADVDEMEQMIRGYLDFARGNQTEETSKVKLSVFLNDILDAFPHEKHRIRLTVKQDPTLDIRYGGLKRCITNLLSNALRYASQVQITGETDAEHVVILVDDNGPGIPPDKYRDVFMPFFRLDKSRNQETGGTGLGLSIARDIVHGHGGEITLDQSPMKGLRVRVELPR